MPHVVIRGTDGNLTVEIDGQRPQYLRAFRLLAEGPDELPILQLDLDMTQVDVDIQAEVTHSQSATADVQRANQSLRQRQEELRHELEGAYERIRQLERGLTVTREGTRGYAGPQRTRADTVQEFVQRHAAAHRTLDGRVISHSEPIVSPPAQEMGRTPRRRMRRNQAWRQRYNELFEEIASTSDAGSTRWPEITRVRVREEMARGGDPDPGRVFPGADDVRSRLEPTDSVATPERPVEASRALPPTTPLGHVVAVDPGREDEATAVLDWHRPDGGVAVVDRRTLRAGRPDLVANPRTVDRLTVEAFVHRCGNRIARERDSGLAVVLVDIAEWLPSRNTVVWRCGPDTGTWAHIRAATHLVLVCEASRWMYFIANADYRAEATVDGSRDRISGEGPVLDRSPIGEVAGSGVRTSPFVPADTVIAMDPTQMRDRFFGLSVPDASSTQWSNPYPDGPGEPFPTEPEFEGPSDVTEEDQAAVEALRAQQTATNPVLEAHELDSGDAATAP